MMNQINSFDEKTKRDEGIKQKRLYDRTIEEGFVLEPGSDPQNLIGNVGNFVKFQVFCESWTEHYLCKLYLVSDGEKENNAFHLVPLWQILRFLKVLPQPDTFFEGEFIVGIRKNEGTRTFVPALRLPRK